MHSSEFGKIFKSNIFTEHLRATASVFQKNEWSDFDQNLQKLGNFGSFRLHKLLFHKNHCLDKDGDMIRKNILVLE